jgi:hypothetical protein
MSHRTASHYPLVRCNDHDLAPGYVVCVHILAGEPIAHEVEPDDELGEALCAACDGVPITTIDALRLVCVHCLRKVTT